MLAPQAASASSVPFWNQPLPQEKKEKRKNCLQQSFNRQIHGTGSANPECSLLRDGDIPTHAAAVWGPRCGCHQSNLPVVPTPSGSSRNSSHPWQETLALSCWGINEAARLHFGWAEILEETWWFRGTNVADAIPQTLQLPLGCSASAASISTEPWGTGHPQLLPPKAAKLPPCYLPVCSSGATCWDFSGSLGFIHSAAKIRPAMVPRGTLFLVWYVENAFLML